MIDRMKYRVILISLLMSLTSSLLASPTQDEVKDMKKIVGYFPSWGVYGLHRKYSVDKIPWDKLTHVNIAFAQTKEDTYEIKSADTWADFGITFGEAWNSPYKGNYGQFKKLRVAHPHVSVLVSIGGWTLSGVFAKAAKTQENREKFAKNAVSFMLEHKLDGIDIDWEYPASVRQPDKVDNINDQGTPYETEESTQNFTLLLKELRKQLTAAGEKDGNYYQLTAAVGAYRRSIEKTEPAKYAQYLDFINLMTYDMHGAWEDKTNHQSPLFSNPNLPNDGVNASNAAFIFADEYGIERNKIVVGSPFYSRGWKNVECDPKLVIKNKDGSALPGLYCNTNSGAKGRWDGGRAAGVNAWFDIVNIMLKDNTFKVYRDDYSKVPYLYSKDKKEFYTYEDELSVKAKVDFVNDENFGGIIFWELSADTRSDLGEGNSLLDVIHKGFYPDGNTKSIVSAPIKAPDETKTRDALVEEKLKQSGKNAQEGAASSEGIAPFDPEHGPKWNKHYDKGEKVALGNSVCTANWWTNKSPGDAPADWTCIDKGKPQASVVVPAATKTKALEAAKVIKAETIEKGEEGAAVLQSLEKTITAAKEEANKVAAQLVEKTVKSEEINKPKKTAIDIVQEEEEANKCHNGKVYKNGELCKYTDNKWYKFKWWTEFKGTIETSMVKVDVESIDTPKLKQVPAKNLNKWSSSRVYTDKGTIVVDDGFVFKSKWWTQGNKPEKYNSSSPWEFIGVADMGQTATDEGTKAPSPEEVKAKSLSSENPIAVADDEVGTTATYDPVTKNTIVTENNPAVKKLPVATAGEKFFMPFVDVTMWPPYNFQDGIDNGIKNFALAFVNSAGSCSPTWGVYSQYTIENTVLNLPQHIQTITKNGGSVMISFGGATAYDNALANTCTTVEDLAAAYQEVLDKTGVKMLDFDIEGGNAFDKATVLRRMKALKIIQDNNPDVELSFTLATMPSGLMAESGLMIVKAAIDEKIKFKAINLMLMDYGTAFPANVPGAKKMASYSILALQTVNAQLHTLLDDKSREDYPQDADSEFYNLLGAIPMIGKNDVLNEWFYADDVTSLVDWCDKHGVRMTSMWSVNRDKAIADGESESAMLYKSTKLKSDDYGSGKYEFSKLLQRGK